jgi:hypothetical protein
MKNIMLFYKCGAIKDFFEKETEKRIRAEYSERVEKEILRNMLTDTDTAIAYVKRVNEIKTAVKAEITAVLDFDVDVGFDPNATTNGISNQVNELSEALNMILEGVTE